MAIIKKIGNNPTGALTFRNAADNSTLGTLSNVGVWSLGTAGGSNSHTLFGTGVGISGPASDTTLRIQVGNNTSISIIDFGDSANDSIGRIMYDHSSDSMAFRVGGSGINKGSISSAGVWILGPPAGVAATSQVTANNFLIGADDLHAGGSYLTIGRRSLGTKLAYIVAGQGNECGLEFLSRNVGGSAVTAGSYNSSNAWSFGNGTGQVHNFNCQTNGSGPGAVVTYMRLSVNGTVYKVALLGNT